MRKIVRTSKFARDLKRSIKKHRNITKLATVVETLQVRGTLPKKYSPHKLSGNWYPYFECHIESDWLLIYEVTDDSLALIRLGSHDELF
jgi:mRNA interferase YafQ